MAEPQDPQDPQYPSEPGYPPLPPIATPTPRPGAGPGTGLTERTLRRPEPRLGVTLAGTGVALAVLGVVVWGGDFLAGTGGGGGGDDGSSGRRWLGIVLSLAVVAAGYALVVRRVRGPLAAAGVGAGALGIPVLLGFSTFDTAHGGQSGPPFSLDVIVLVSVLVWLVSYFWMPGARGHVFYLGLAALVLWPYAVDKAEPGVFSQAFFLPFLSGDTSLLGADTAPPDWTTVAVLSLFFGLGYYATAYLLDRGGRPGMGVAFVVAGLPATAGGIAAAAVHLHAVGTGVLLIVIGLVLAAYGARAGRRFTGWAWGTGVGLGAVVIIDKLAGDNDAAAGVALILSGAVVVAAGQLLRNVLHEPEDVASP
jgi:hypothetical protein